jgi:hypothetical protein
MTIESLSSAMHATPFRQFRIHMADGRKFEVPHPDYVAFHPKGRTAVVYHLDDEGYDTIDLLLAVSLETLDVATR